MSFYYWQWHTPLIHSKCVSSYNYLRYKNPNTRDFTKGSKRLSKKKASLGHFSFPLIVVSSVRLSWGILYKMTRFVRACKDVHQKRLGSPFVRIGRSLGVSPWATYPSNILAICIVTRHVIPMMIHLACLPLTFLDAKSHIFNLFSLMTAMATHLRSILFSHGKEIL